MLTVAHLSDLHFGCTNPLAVRALRIYLQRVHPDVVIVSGDLTQRATPRQFQQARSFLAQLPGDSLVVPGNHDVPAWNLLARMFWPLGRFREYIHEDTCPMLTRDNLVVLGLNTARSWIGKHGSLSPAQIRTAHDRLSKYGPRFIKVVVTHHPFDLPSSYKEQRVVGRAKLALEKLALGGADILLAGHYHESYAGSATRYDFHGRKALVIQAGTAISTRLRHSANSFNILRIQGDRLDVEILKWDCEIQSFVPGCLNGFVRGPMGFTEQNPESH